MEAQLVRGSLGGLPVHGGTVSLDSAGAADLVNATTGLVREVSSTALTVGLPALFLYAMADAAIRREEKEQAMREEEEQQAREAAARLEFARQAAQNMCDQNAMNTWVDWKLRNECLKYQPDPLEKFHKLSIDQGLFPLSGLCRVSARGELFNGICMQKQIAFESDDEIRCIDIRYVRGIIRDVLGNGKCELLAIDGSRFRVSKFKSDLVFMTIAGPVKVTVENLLYIRGLNSAELSKVRQLLIDNLRDFRREAVELIGEDLVQKYFRVEPAKPAAPVYKLQFGPPPAQPLRIPSRTGT